MCPFKKISFLVIVVLLFCFVGCSAEKDGTIANTKIIETSSGEKIEVVKNSKKVDSAVDETSSTTDTVKKEEKILTWMEAADKINLSKNIMQTAQILYGSTDTQAAYIDIGNPLLNPVSLKGMPIVIDDPGLLLTGAKVVYNGKEVTSTTEWSELNVLTFSKDVVIPAGSGGELRVYVNASNHRSIEYDTISVFIFRVGIEMNKKTFHDLLGKEMSYEAVATCLTDDVVRAKQVRKYVEFFKLYAKVLKSGVIHIILTDMDIDEVLKGKGYSISKYNKIFDSHERCYYYLDENGKKIDFIMLLFKEGDLGGFIIRNHFFPDIYYQNKFPIPSEDISSFIDDRDRE